MDARELLGKPTTEHDGSTWIDYQKAADVISQLQGEQRMSVELTLACDMMHKFEKAYGEVPLTVMETLAVVRVYAAIAQVEATREQTEQLKRIADALYCESNFTKGQVISLAELVYGLQRS